MLGPFGYTHQDPFSSTCWHQPQVYAQSQAYTQAPPAWAHPLPPTPYAIPTHHTPHHIPTPYLPHSSYVPPTPLHHHSTPVIPPVYSLDDDFKDDGLTFAPSGERPPGPRNLQPRPVYWRLDYPNKRPSCPLRRFFASWNQDQVRLDSLLRYKSKKLPAVRYDLRVRPSQDPHFSLPAAHRLPITRDLLRFATDPPLPEIRLWHRRLPWYIDIISTGYGGVTIADLLDQLHEDLFRYITLYDYWTTDLSPTQRERIDQTCNKRRFTINHAQLPICRIDFLHDDFIFAGLTPSSDGTFQMKTVSFYNRVI